MTTIRHHNNAPTSNIMDPISPQLERTAQTAQSPQERPKLRRGLSAVRLADDKGSVHTYNEVYN